MEDTMVDFSSTFRGLSEVFVDLQHNDVLSE